MVKMRMIDRPLVEGANARGWLMSVPIVCERVRESCCMVIQRSGMVVRIMEKRV